jgi:glutathione synthase/RimK-type ligase-like ATP-grasp enzyme
LKNSLLTNLVKDGPLTNKIELHKLFPEEKFIKPFQIISLGNKDSSIEKQIDDFTTIKILKPEGGYAGKGIYLVNGKDEAIYTIKHHRDTYSYRYLLQDYIMEPALIQGHKFHLRVPILVIGKQKFMYCKSPYYVAKSLFKQDNFDNKDIHDTHYNPEFSQFYPDTLPDGWGKKVSLTFLEKVFEKLELKPEWKSKHSYYLFGADIMFEKKNPILLEINEKIGLKDMEFIVPDLITILLDGKTKNWKEL